MSIRYRTLEQNKVTPQKPGYLQRSINDVSDYRSRRLLDRDKLYRILFFTDTKEGWTLEFLIMLGVLVSTTVVFVDSIGDIKGIGEQILKGVQWFFTISLALEYLLRLYAARRIRKYIFGFYGIIDLVAFLPTFFMLSVVSTHYALIFRLLRLLSIFRVFHLGRFVQEGKVFANALKQSSIKIVIFILWLVVIVCVLGTIMFLVEGRINPMFSSIPRSIYWAIITLTTVGYGDITPITAMGQFISTVVMLLGYSIIAVPTGIVTAEVAKETTAFIEKDNKAVGGGATAQKLQKRHKEQVFCYSCGYQNRDLNAIYCGKCGTPLIQLPNRQDSVTNDPLKNEKKGQSELGPQS